MTKRVPDTSDLPEHTKRINILRGLRGLSNGSIERQEAQGQHDLVASTQLPVKGTKDKEEMWAKMGIELGPLRPDDIFRDAVLPPGWELKATYHHMWSDLVDANGMPRAGIFYKAAFYDRRAHVRLNRRFSYTQDYDTPATVVCWVVTDRCIKTPLYSVQFDVPSRMKQFQEHYAKIRSLEQEHGNAGGCRSWLKKHYPNYEDPTEYWEV